MKYRIRQDNKNTFIPQYREYFFLKWEAIDNIGNYVWSNTEKYSYNKTYGEAYEVIQRHKRYLKTDKYPKYYKI